jgi:hypothetical protein
MCRTDRPAEQATERTPPDDYALDLPSEVNEKLGDDADPLDDLDRQQGIGPYRTGRAPV